MKNLSLLFLLIFGITNAQIYSENFDSGSSFPTGWTTSNSNNPSQIWQIGTTGVFGAPYFNSNNVSSGNVAVFDASMFFGNLNPAVVLESPVINLSTYPNAKLSFKFTSGTFDTTNLPTFKVEAYNGTSWVQVFSFIGDNTTFTPDGNSFVLTDVNNVDLAPYTNANFKMRFTFNDGAGIIVLGCAVDEIVITNGALGTSEVADNNAMQVYPNPVKDVLYIKSKENAGAKMNVTVIDMSGRKVKSFNGSGSYNVSDLEKGTYILLIKEGDKVIQKKIIKE